MDTPDFYGVPDLAVMPKLMWKIQGENKAKALLSLKFALFSQVWSSIVKRKEQHELISRTAFGNRDHETEWPIIFGSMYVVARGVHVTKFRDISSVNSWFPVLSAKTEEM